MIKEHRQSKTYLTEQQVAEMTERAVGTLRNDRWMDRGIPFIRFGRQVRYDLDDVIAFMESHRVSTNERF